MDQGLQVSDPFSPLSWSTGFSRSSEDRLKPVLQLSSRPRQTAEKPTTDGTDNTDKDKKLLFITVAVYAFFVSSGVGV